MVLNGFLLIMAIGLFACLIINKVSEKKNGKNDEFFSKCGTDALKGFSIVMIALAHICQYVPDFKQILVGGGTAYRLIFSWGAIGVSLFFFLSGYGCYLSISKKDKYGLWILKHIIKMIIHYIVAFVLVIALCILYFGVQLSWNEVLWEFVTLRMPGSTVWYFKIQILFYVFLVIAAIISKKNMVIIVACFSIMYALVADYVLKLPDFWWKTALCFATGCFIAQYKDKVKELVQKHVVKILLFMMACGAYFLLMKDGHCRIYVQLPAYILISLCIAVFWDWLIGGNTILGKLGKCSLDIYLVHIGIVEYVFLTNMNLNYKIMLFFVVVSIVTVICYSMAECIYKNIITVLKI